MKQTDKSATSLWEFGGIISLCFGWFIVVSVVSLFIGIGDKNFSDGASMQLVIFELIIGSLALAVLHWRGHVLRELVPAPSWKGAAAGIWLCACAYLAYLIAWTLFGRHLPEQPIDRILAASKPSMGMVLLLAVVNGTYEEVFVLGYVVRAMGKYGGSFAIGMSTLIRLSYHVYQGPLGATSVALFGVILGIFYWRTRELWPCVFAHMLCDVLAFS